MAKLAPCPVCGGWWKVPEPNPKMAMPDYVCVLCETELWLTDAQRRARNSITVKENEYFFLDHEPREIMPSGPPKKATGGSQSKNRNKKKGTQKYIEPWTYET